VLSPTAPTFYDPVVLKGTDEKIVGATNVAAVKISHSHADEIPEVEFGKMPDPILKGFHRGFFDSDERKLPHRAGKSAREQQFPESDHSAFDQRLPH
jgi:hypothetical protein